MAAVISFPESGVWDFCCHPHTALPLTMMPVFLEDFADLKKENITYWKPSH